MLYTICLRWKKTSLRVSYIKVKYFNFEHNVYSPIIKLDISLVAGIEHTQYEDVHKWRKHLMAKKFSWAEVQSRIEQVPGLVQLLGEISETKYVTIYQVINFIFFVAHACMHAYTHAHSVKHTVLCTYT